MEQGKDFWEYEVHELSEGFSAIVYDSNGLGVPGLDHLSEDEAARIVRDHNAVARPDEAMFRKYPYVLILNSQTIRFRTANDRDSFMSEWGKEGDIAECHYDFPAALGGTDAA